ncbi:Anthranilate phosphoribosyltransferase [Frankliniella fusca]|uniref:Anthranilate phosphoribosyltransferase n=1 Tax=Frankliniella fusca TaxID=407009 RepID=A0AAE1H1R9_9NEOP|nr:Anthranilate phosphoribosyltransferase [Frankliniella fusca]
MTLVPAPPRYATELRRARVLISLFQGAAWNDSFRSCTVDSQRVKLSCARRCRSAADASAAFCASVAAALRSAHAQGDTDLTREPDPPHLELPVTQQVPLPVLEQLQLALAGLGHLAHALVLARLLAVQLLRQLGAQLRLLLGVQLALVLLAALVPAEAQQVGADLVAAPLLPQLALLLHLAQQVHLVQLVALAPQPAHFVLPPRRVDTLNDRLAD